MNGIRLLEQEHDNILRMIEVVHQASLRALQEKTIDIQDFKKMVDFIRNYADKTHHGKEEKYLFQAMTDSLGRMADNLIRHGMLVEHDLARLYVSELDTALNERVIQSTDENLLQILVAAGSYCELLKRHIDKENNVVFPYSEKNLDSVLMQKINQEMDAFEQENENAGTRNHQLQTLKMLEDKYL